MLKYGQIVKLVYPKKLAVMSRFKSLRTDLAEFFKYDIKKVPQLKSGNGFRYNSLPLRERGGFTDYIFTIPKDTLGILSYGNISSTKEEFSVFIMNPKTKKLGINLKLSLAPDDFTSDIGAREFFQMEEAQKKFILDKRTQDGNLQIIERVVGFADEVTVDK